MDDLFNQPSFPFVLFLLIASPIAWVLYAVRVSKHGPLTHEPRDEVPWGMFDLLLLIIFLFVGQLAATVFVKNMYGIDFPNKVGDFANLPAVDRARVIATNSVIKLLATVLGFAAIALKNRASLTDLGIHVGRAPRDLLLGAFSFLLLVPPVLLIQTILVLWWESKHPLVEMLQDDPSVYFFMVTILSAVVVAPGVEELMYRVLLQGWMEKISSHEGDPTELLLGRVPRHRDTVGSDEKRASSPTWWPILASAAIFALMHHQHGPDPIPLFLFAMGLGYLYQRTHRILPSIVVHFLLNATSVAVLMLDLPGAD